MSVTANTAYFDPELEDLADQMARGFEVDPKSVLDKFSSISPRSSGIKAAAVHLSPVSTFILGAKDESFGYLVSSIAKHWGVLVGDNEKYLFHLVFQNRADIPSNANPDSLTGKARAVMFDARIWDSSGTQPSSVMYVGDTHYDPFELAEISCSEDMACTDK